MKKEKDIIIDQELLNDMTADQLQDYPDIEEEYLRELKRNRYPKGL